MLLDRELEPVPFDAEGAKRLLADAGWEDHDGNGTLDEIWDGCTLLDMLWEGIMLRDGFFIAIYLANNEYGLCFVIPDAPWVNGELREVIEQNLDP